MKAGGRHISQGSKRRPVDRTQREPRQQHEETQNLEAGGEIPKLISEPLRQEAERKWAKSERSAARRSRRGEAKEDEIGRLKGKLKRAEQSAATPRHGKGDAGRGDI